MNFSEELIERLIMLELSKEIARSQAAEQKNILDTILDGAQKAAQVVNNIKSISSGMEPKQTNPLFCEKENFMPKAPITPSFMSQEVDSLSSACDAIATIRSKLDALYKEQIISKIDLQPIMKELYDLHLAVFNQIKK